MEKEISIRYKDMGTMEFQTLLMKIGNSPMPVSKAAALRGTLEKIQAAKESMFKEYQGYTEKFAVKDEKGKIQFDEHGNYTIPTEHEEEFSKIVEEFHKKEAKLTCEPLTAFLLSEVKVSPKELTTLGELFVNEQGPGLPPQLASVR